MSTFNQFDEDKEVHRKRLNAFTIIIVLLLYTLYVLHNSSGASATIACDGTGYGVSSTTGEQYIVYFTDCKSVELLDTYDEGTCVDGVTDKNLHFGTFRNDTDGEYSLCVNPKLTTYIRLITNDDHVYILNFESAKTTQTLYDQAAAAIQ